MRETIGAGKQLLPREKLAIPKRNTIVGCQRDHRIEKKLQ